MRKNDGSNEGLTRTQEGSSQVLSPSCGSGDGTAEPLCGCRRRGWVCSLTPLPRSCLAGLVASALETLPSKGTRQEGVRATVIFCRRELIKEQVPEDNTSAPPPPAPPPKKKTEKILFISAEL